MNISDIRKDYKLRSLTEEEVDEDPLIQFQLWWNEAIESNVDEVNAMTLATVAKDGMPSARIVLLKGLGNDGFIFFTNYESKKGVELKDNPKVCLVFFWKELERQIRIQGTVSKISEQESDEYFSSRPRISRIGAWSSPQSKVITDRDVLEKNALLYQHKFTDENIPRPANWGGYAVTPLRIEFWQGRPGRLHDRIQYTLQDDKWIVERLAP